MTKTVAEAIVAAARFADALNAPQEPARVREAFTAEAAIERMGVFERQGELVEEFQGHEQISAWLSRTPEGIQFSVAGVEAAADGSWRARYGYKVLSDGFEHGGTWLIKLSEDGRIRWLRHDPDPLNT